MARTYFLSEIYCSSNLHGGTKNYIMPCSDGTPPSSYYEGEIRDLTQMLCEACRHIQSKNGMTQTSGQLQAWWKQHEAEDERRMKLKKERENNKPFRINLHPILYISYYSPSHGGVSNKLLCIGLFKKFRYFHL